MIRYKIKLENPKLIWNILDEIQNPHIVTFSSLNAREKTELSDNKGIGKFITEHDTMYSFQTNKLDFDTNNQVLTEIVS